MLNRLMFVYFIQRKGFLDGDSDYLRNRLARMRREYGHDRFYSFYRFFLLRLFHEGLGGKTRTSELEKLLGKIPYFDGGFFEKHPVEQRYPDIRIPDKAFERIFDYFDQYQWHLDERPLRADNEINPDVLGYIFEKYINQKQMGAYYTKEDITEYISKNTVIPFLFAALNILEPLYEACLDRMAAFVEDLDRSGEKHRPEKYSDFRKVLKQVEAHPNRRYFVFKNIILNNLFGVDIMEEAVEICKLRLFLKLVAQVEPDLNKDNFGIEPLPDIDFNIRAGNTLVGYATAEEVRKVFKENPCGKQVQYKLMLRETQSEYNRFEEQVELADRAFKQFHRMQTDPDMDPKDFANSKQTLRERLRVLNDELDRHLASEYAVKLPSLSGRGTKGEGDAYDKWLRSHQPFHWFVEFYGIMQSGGFDVIIGNPPYLELRQVNYSPKNYRCLDGAAVHSMCIERSVCLLSTKGGMSMIVPLALPSTQRMQIVQQILEADHNAWYANYAWRPGKLFDTVNRALTVFVITPSTEGRTFSTNYQKWTSEDRDGLFERLSYVNIQRNRPAFWVPKLGARVERSILKKCLSVKTATMHFAGSSSNQVYYRTDGGLYWKVFTDFAPAFSLNGKSCHSSRETSFTVVKREQLKPLIAALSSDVFWWWYTISSNLRDLNPYDIRNFPIPESAIIDPELCNLGVNYLKDINKYSAMLVREQKQTGRTETQSFKIQKSKPIIDQIDQVLAKHYGFTDEELDFIINYDIKHRMGRGADGGEDDD